MERNYTKLFDQLQIFEDKISYLEDRILHLEERINFLTQIERNHLIRVKNKEEVSDDFILQGRTYQDLSPEKAWRLYCNKELDFIFLDVTSKDFKRTREIPEAIHIPWEELSDRFSEIHSRTTPIIIISEDGTNSILACEFLVKRGFYNCNNVSGGYKHWKGFALRDVNGQTA